MKSYLKFKLHGINFLFKILRKNLNGGSDIHLSHVYVWEVTVQAKKLKEEKRNKGENMCFTTAFLIYSAYNYGTTNSAG